MNTLVIMQPTFLPWLGYFHLMAQADIFVVYDSVQFSKQSWQQRNRIRNKAGEILLSLPVITKNKSVQSIKKVEINYSDKFVKKHLATLTQSYSKTLNFLKFFPLIEEIYNSKPLYMSEFNWKLINLGRDIFKLNPIVHFSSEIQNLPEGRVEPLVHICQTFKASTYLSPQGSREYIEENNLFLENSIDLKYQDFCHPTYKQASYKDFISHLSFLDFIFNVENPESFFKKN